MQELHKLRTCLISNPPFLSYNHNINIQPLFLQSHQLNHSQQTTPVHQLLQSNTNYLILKFKNISSSISNMTPHELRNYWLQLSRQWKHQKYTKYANHLKLTATNISDDTLHHIISLSNQSTSAFQEQLASMGVLCELQFNQPIIIYNNDVIEWIMHPHLLTTNQVDQLTLTTTTTILTLDINDLILKADNDNHSRVVLRLGTHTNDFAPRPDKQPNNRREYAIYNNITNEQLLPAQDLAFALASYFNIAGQFCETINPQLMEKQKEHIHNIKQDCYAPFYNGYWSSLWISTFTHTNVHRDKKDKYWSSILYGGDMHIQNGFMLPTFNCLFRHGKGSFVAGNGSQYDHCSLPTKDSCRIMYAAYVT